MVAVLLAYKIVGSIEKNAKNWRYQCKCVNIGFQQIDVEVPTTYRCFFSHRFLKNMFYATGEILMYVWDR